MPGIGGNPQEQRGTETEKSPRLNARETERVVPVRREREVIRETEVERIERKILEAERPRVEGGRPGAARPQPPPPPTPRKDPLTNEIEKILSDDLQGVYTELTPEQKVVFRREGEHAALTIRHLLEQMKLKAKSILDIIRRWLKLIPGINRFFLEQEAKIKTDRVMALHERIHSHRP